MVMKRLDTYSVHISCLSLFNVQFHSRWWDKPLTELKLRDSYISPNTTCSQAVNYMKAESLNEVPIVSDDK